MSTQVKRFLVCGGGCLSSGSAKLAETLQSELSKQGFTEVPVVLTGCQGFCEQGPSIIVEPEETLYCRVQPEDVADLVQSHVVAGQVYQPLLYQVPATGAKPASYHEVPFFAQQQIEVLANCGHLDPDDIEEYIAKDGYQGLTKALQELTPTQTIEEIKQAGLRGRGGAGFPTGLKWEIAQSATDIKKYVVCNADEGDPGAFMDRSLLEGDPHVLIEGMLICGYAIGADEGYIYVRAEYPVAISRLKTAITQAEQRGYLGKNILGTGFNFKLKIKAGAGAFVCGEETALLNSIEGERGMPRTKPPFPAVKGLWGKPTNINNVETYANVPLIIRKGAEWYASIGTAKSKGTKVFALSGKVNNTGLVEVPMGISLRKIIFDIGGGIMDGKKFKAVQIGGPSGGCLPEAQLDLPVDYDSLLAAGAMMGSGGLVVMDETTCMVDLARYFLNFTQQESCGKCTPCREGTKRMLEILQKITAGKGSLEDLDNLEQLAQVIRKTSSCGLGQAAPNPVLATLRYFREEYLAHIEEDRCPAGACTALLNYYIDTAICRGCGLCSKKCPVSAITGELKKAYEIDGAKCIKCGICVFKCKFNAVLKGGR